MTIVRYGVIACRREHREANLGDDIQAIAAARFLPRVDLTLEREAMFAYRDEVFAIMNGWWMHRPEGFPPPANIKPYITSMHISPSAAAGMLTPRGLNFFRTHQPVGCRDLFTKELLIGHGIDARFSGCLTLTLDRASFSTRSARSPQVLLVDPFYRYTPGGIRARLRHLVYMNVTRFRLLKRITGSSAAGSAAYTTHFLGSASASFEERADRARRLLGKYASASLVITSRLHAALPCLALGTPVLFVTENSGDPRFSGNLALLNVLTRADVEAITEPGVIRVGGRRMRCEEIQNPPGYLTLREWLIAEVSQAVARAS